MSENTKAAIAVSNNTSTVFRKAGVHLDWGKVEIAQLDIMDYTAPGEPSQPKGCVFGSEGAAGSASGTSGWVKWIVDGDPTATMQINFDSPFSPGNSASISCSPSFLKTYTVSPAESGDLHVNRDGNCEVILNIKARG